MPFVSFLFAGFLLVLAAREVICLQDKADGGEMGMEQEELSGLFEVLSFLLEDPTWAQMHPQPCSDTPWPGVQCEIGLDPPIFHVTKIHIGPDIVTPPCKTSAKLSQSLVKLPYLKTLSLFNCFTTLPVSLSPTLFGSFSSLEHLSLKFNPTLSGEIPPSLAEVVNLRVLCLSQNNLQAKIPQNIGGWVSLEQLDLSYNNLSGSIPEEIGGLKSLTIMDISWNNLEGLVPSSLGQLHLLQKIDLSSNKLQGMVPQSLGKLNRLVLLDLSHNLLVGPIPETLIGLQQLQYLMIQENQINTGLPWFIRTLKNLKVLSFSRCGLKGQLPNSLSFLKDLTALSLDNNSLNGKVPPNLGTFPNLDQLNLSHNQLSGELELPAEFIIRLGKRLDVRGNTGLCIKQELYKDKNNTTYLETPSCLDTSSSEKNSSSTWSEEHIPNDYNTVKPIWHHEKAISSTLEVDHKKLVLLIFVVWFRTFLL